MSPLNDHEAYTALLDQVLTTVMSGWDVNLYCTRSATLKAKPLGAEPDTSYYIQHAGSVDDLKAIDLRTSPPPDLVVEVDMSNRRMDKVALYARLGVPEFRSTAERDFKRLVWSTASTCKSRSVWLFRDYR